MGRKVYCHVRIARWQDLLKKGYSIEAVALNEAKICGSKTLGNSLRYYRRRILELIELGELKA